MIYDKPRDINLRVFPSLSSLVPQRTKKSTSTFEETLSDSNSRKNVIQVKKEDAAQSAPSALPLENPDIILPEKPNHISQNIIDNTEDEAIFDISEMQVIDGIPILDLKEVSNERTTDIIDYAVNVLTDEQSDDIEVDISEIPDITGIPLLTLPDRPIQETKTTEGIATDETASDNTLTEDDSTNIVELIQPPLEPDSVSQETTENENNDSTEEFRSYDEAVKKAKEKELAKERAKAEKERARAERPLKEKERAEARAEKTKAKKIKADQQKAKRKAKSDELKAKRKENAKLIIEKASKNRARLLKIAAFFLMLYSGTVLAFIIPLRPSYSETEKRLLAEFPEFTAETFVSGDYFSDISTWFSDTFPFREGLTKFNTKIKNLYGFDTISIHGDVEQGDEIPDAPLEQPPVKETEPEPETKPQAPVTMPNEEDLKTDNGDPSAARPDYNTQSLGAIIVANDSAYEYYTFSEDLAPRFINSVSSIKNAAHNKSNVYAMVVPTSIDIKLNDALRSDISSANQKKALDYFNASFKNSIVVDGIYDAERLHRDEYTYFRTDHHWTALGAYYAYEQFAQTKGIKPIPLSKYKTRTFDGFLGTFYSGSGQTAKLGETPDKVIAYLPFNNTTCHIVEANGNAFDWDVIKDVTDYDPGMKYITFIGGDNAITTITNKDNPNGETCIVIKESFGNAFVPFLIPHYSTIYVIDPRHYSGTLSEFTEDKVINDIILLTNISTTRNYVFIDAMEELIQ